MGRGGGNERLPDSGRWLWRKTHLTLGQPPKAEEQMNYLIEFYQFLSYRYPFCPPFPLFLISSFPILFLSLLESSYCRDWMM